MELSPVKMDQPNFVNIELELPAVITSTIHNPLSPNFAQLISNMCFPSDLLILICHCHILGKIHENMAWEAQLSHFLKQGCRLTIQRILACDWSKFMRYCEVPCDVLWEGAQGGLIECQ